jgi:hypothetical protein
MERGRTPNFAGEKRGDKPSMRRSRIPSNCLLNWKQLLENGVPSVMHIPRKLKRLGLLYVGFWVMYYEALHFIEFWKPSGGLEHETIIKWSIDTVFFAVSVWFGRRAFVLLRDDDPRDNDRV